MFLDIRSAERFRAPNQVHSPASIAMGGTLRGRLTSHQIGASLVNPNLAPCWYTHFPHLARPGWPVYPTRSDTFTKLIV